MNEIANALIVIQEDLLNCKSAKELGTKYSNYLKIIQSFFLKGIDILVESEGKDSGV